MEGLGDCYDPGFGSDRLVESSSPTKKRQVKRKGKGKGGKGPAALLVQRYKKKYWGQARYM